MIGEDGVNSNSCVSSLIVAKGGATGLADVKAITSVVDTSPVRTAGQPATMHDREMAELVRRDCESGRLVAAGFGNASVEPARFTHDRLPEAVAPRDGTRLSSLSAALPAAIAGFTARTLNWASSEVEKARSFHRSTWSDRTVYAGRMHVHYAGKDRKFGTARNVRDVERAASRRSERADAASGRAVAPSLDEQRVTS